MLDGLIEGGLASAIAECVSVDDITELHLRIGRPLVIYTKDLRIVLKNCGLPYIVSKEDIQRILSIATNMSLYSVNDELKKGFIPCKNARIGVCGEGVVDNGKLLTQKNISYLTIRIPHQIFGIADGIIEDVVGKQTKNTLIVSPPSAGKTTLLRELARLSSKSRNVIIIDERYEIACSTNGIPRLDVGDADVISGIAKDVAYENCVRALNPEIIVTDELFRLCEVEAICDIVRSGVAVFASVHGEDIYALKKSKVFCQLLDVFDCAVVLCKTPSVGTIKKIVDLRKYTSNEINEEKLLL